MILDSVFGRDNLHNEIIWQYRKFPNKAKYFQRNHDVILYYSKNNNYTFNRQFNGVTTFMKQVRKRGYNKKIKDGRRLLTVYNRNNPKAKKQIESGNFDRIYYIKTPKGNVLSDCWDISIIGSIAKERTGYPTQKPLALLTRIIEASSNDSVLTLDYNMTQRTQT